MTQPPSKAFTWGQPQVEQGMVDIPNIEVWVVGRNPVGTPPESLAGF